MADGKTIDSTPALAIKSINSVGDSPNVVVMNDFEKSKNVDRLAESLVSSGVLRLEPKEEVSPSE